MLADGRCGTLVLLDEVGSGTDPAEGAALAAAVLLELTRRGALTLATTHLGALKSLAAEARRDRQRLAAVRHRDAQSDLSLPERRSRPILRFVHRAKARS